MSLIYFLNHFFKTYFQMETRNVFRIVLMTFLAVAAQFAAFAQNDLGEACGCPEVSARTTTVNLSTLADSDGVLTADNTVLTCDKMYVIDDKIYVGDGKSLTINPGTVLKGTLGTPGDANALIVSKGGKIFAAGTEDCQIVFTANDDPMDGTYGIENKGKWGGVVLLGKAKNNLVGGTGGLAIADGIGFIEGFTAANPNNQFGMPPGQEDDNDNSGIMTYVSIRHAGDIAGADNELNGLTLGSVGRGTTLHHIEVVSNLDDGIEFFGGSVDLKYAAVLFNDDDGFDWDLGWSGRGQFWVVVKTDQATADGGDNGFECDGDDKDQALYYASPVVYNATFIGSQDVNTGITGTPDTDVAMELKEATRGEIRNCILANYGTGVRLYGEQSPKHDGPNGEMGDSYALWTNGELIVENNTFVNVATFMAGEKGAVITPADETTFTNNGNSNVASIPGFAAPHQMNVSTNAVATKHDLIPSNNTVAGVASAVPVDGFFTPAPYRGAFDATQKSWLSNYSYNALIGLQGNLLPCPSDITGDGAVNTNDFNQLILDFNSICD